MALARLLAEFVHSIEMDNIPSDVIEKAKTCLLNGYGIGLGSHNTPYAAVARRTVLSIDGERTDGATLLGDGRKTTIPGAVLANAALFHGRAQEDTCGSAHFGTVVIPLLTALVETHRVPVARLLPSLVAGYEVGGLLEHVYTGNTTAGGFRASPLYGTIAAAAAAGKSMGLSVEQLTAAMANAASFAGGVLQSFSDGTDEWRYQVGVAGRLGTVAAELARAGSVSAPHAFEGHAGFIRAFARTESDPSTVMSKLGSEWSIRRVAFKPYPVCAANQTPVIAALAVRTKIGRHGIASARARMCPFVIGYEGINTTGPFASISGTLMSAPFCIASTLLRGEPTMQRMTTYDDAEVNTLTARIELVPDETMGIHSCDIEVVLDDGHRIGVEQRMTAADYSYDRQDVASLIRRVGKETGVPAEAFDHLESFVENLPNADIGLIMQSFALLPSSRPVRLA